MSSSAFRRATTALLLVALVSLTAASPSYAFLPTRRSFDGPIRTAPVEAGGFLGFLLRFFDFAGGAMDPNGNS